MNTESITELEALIIANVLNDPQKLKSIAVLPEYFHDKSFQAVIEYITGNTLYNLYDMCMDLHMNLELVTEMATCSCDKETFQHRVLLLLDQHKLREYLKEEIMSAMTALAEIDPIRIGEIMYHNLGKIFEQRTIPSISH